ncbi:MAG: hypothetical protein R2715_16890 [Ilumatobacteraceae bacterium]
MTCHKYTAHEVDPVLADGRPELMSGMWSDPIVGRPETCRCSEPVPPGVCTPVRPGHASWSKGHSRSTGTRTGCSPEPASATATCSAGTPGSSATKPSAAGSPSTVPAPDPGRRGRTPEISRIVVAFCPSSNLRFGEYPKSISALSDQGDLGYIAGRLFGRIGEDSIARIRHGNAVMVVCHPCGSGGGEVVTIGTTDWVFGLGDRFVDQVTRNAIGRFRPFTLTSSVTRCRRSLDVVRHLTSSVT